MNELDKELKRFDKETSTDQDPISNRILKEAKSPLRKNFWHYSIIACYRERWRLIEKKNLISMLSKKNRDKNSTKGYMPIRIVVCKVVK